MIIFCYLLMSHDFRNFFVVYVHINDLPEKKKTPEVQNCLRAQQNCVVFFLIYSCRLLYNGIKH